MSERLHPAPEPDENSTQSEFFLSAPQKLELTGPIPNYVAGDVSLLVDRKEWKNMPKRNSALHILLNNTSPNLEATAFTPESWLRSNNFLIDMNEEEGRHVMDRRKFRTAIIHLERDFDPKRFEVLLDRVLPHLGREKGNSEIEKIAKAAPVFLIAPPGMKEDLGEILKSREDLFATKAVGKTINGKKYTIGEGRIKKKSEFPYVNLWENSKKKDFDYLGTALSELLYNLKENDPRIKQVLLSSEYLGDRSVERRLRHSNNYLRDIYNAKSGVGIEIEYSCGCRFARYREKGNVYTDKLGKCPSGIEIEKSELPDLEDFRDKDPRRLSQLEFYTDEVEFDGYPKKGKSNLLAIISQGSTEIVCPDNCGKNTLVQTNAGKKGKGYLVIQAYHCPTTGDFLGKKIRNLKENEFLNEFGDK